MGLNHQYHYKYIVVIDLPLVFLSHIYVYGIGFRLYIYRNKLEFPDIEEPSGGEFQIRDNRKSQKA